MRQVSLATGRFIRIRRVHFFSGRTTAVTGRRQKTMTSNPASSAAPVDRFVRLRCSSLATTSTARPRDVMKTVKIDGAIFRQPRAASGMGRETGEWSGTSDGPDDESIWKGGSSIGAGRKRNSTVKRVRTILIDLV